MVDRHLEKRARLSAGEYVTGLSFDGSERFAAAIHTSQGGGAIVVHEVKDGSLGELHAELAANPGDDLADTFGRTAFDLRGERLFVVSYAHEPVHVFALYDVVTGARSWSHQEGTTDASCAAIGFLSYEEAFAVTSRGSQVLVFDARTGTVLRRVAAESIVDACAIGGRLWGLSADGIARVLPV